MILFVRHSRYVQTSIQCLCPADDVNRQTQSIHTNFNWVSVSCRWSYSSDSVEMHTAFPKPYFLFFISFSDNYVMQGFHRTYPRVRRGRFPVVVVVQRRQFLFLKPQQLHREVESHWLRSDLTVTHSHHATPHLQSYQAVTLNSIYPYKYITTPIYSRG
jgi:hypothetical protein